MSRRRPGRRARGSGSSGNRRSRWSWAIAGVLALGVTAALVLAVFDPFGEGLGPDELPAEISESQRDRLGDTLRAFFAGVDQYSPQVTGASMLTPGEVGIEEFARLVLELGALQLGELTFGFEGVGATEVDVAAGVVRAIAATALGPVELELVRREGRWRVARVPLLHQVMREHLPYRYEWTLTNSYPAAQGRLAIVGVLRNVGDTPWLVVGTPGYLAGPDGHALRAETTGLIAEPFVAPGAELPVHLNVEVPAGAEVGAESFVPLPGLRVARGADQEILADRVEVTPAQVPGVEVAGEIAIRLTNGDDGVRSVVAIARLVDGEGRLLAVFRSPTVEFEPGELRIRLPIPESAPTTESSRFELSAWGAKPQG